MFFVSPMRQVFPFSFSSEFINHCHEFFSLFLQFVILASPRNPPQKVLLFHHSNTHQPFPSQQQHQPCLAIATFVPPHLGFCYYEVLFITFLAYACYHASRKPTGIVKSMLCPEHGDLKDSWIPFNGYDGPSKLGEIDVAFLACYSIGMYVAGHLGDTLDLRLFLASGMIDSGIFIGLCGMGYFWNVHRFWFYLSMQMIAGIFSSLRASKLRPWGRCSKYIRQQRTRLYIIWRCTGLLLCWHE